MREITKEQLLEVLDDLAGKDSDWSYAADLFVLWLLENPDSETFYDFLDFLKHDAENWFMPNLPEEDRGLDTWAGFFGYGSNFEEFADDWILDKSDRESYLRFCESSE